MKNSRPSLTWRSVISVTALSSLIVGGLGLGARVTPAAPTALAPPLAPPSLAAPDTTTKARAVETLGKLPLSFEENRGQTDPTVKFLSRGDGYSLFLTPSEAVIALRPQVASRQYSGASREEEKQTAKDKKQKAKRENQSLPPHPQPLVLRMQLLGANPATQVTGQELLPGTSNYFVGNDPSKWRKDVPTYAKVQYDDVYPGIDLIYYGNQQQLEYDFIVAPGADPKAIRLDFAGADKVEVDTQGDLVLHTIVGQIRQQKPFVYQEVNGVKQPVVGRYVVRDFQSSAQPTASCLRPICNIGFEVASYDVTKPLVIDPILSYSTYLGGSGPDEGRAIAIDADGSVYVTGDNVGGEFPITVGAFQTTVGPLDDPIFVTKFDATGSLVYSTYLGGSFSFGSMGDSAYAIAVDTVGNVTVVGSTGLSTFPTTPGAFQTTYGGGPLDAFITKLNATGSALLYSTYLGTPDRDLATGIALDPSGNAYVAATTEGTADISSDILVVKLNPSGSALVYDAVFGGSGIDSSTAIVVDAAGNVYVAGSTFSSDFPTTPNAFQPTSGGGCSITADSCGDAFVSKINAAGNTLLYSTYLGGSGGERGNSIALDTAGNIYVTGGTNSSASRLRPFPISFEAVQTIYGGGLFDAFVVKLNASGSLAYSTFLGGNEEERGTSLVLDASNNAYVTGFTRSLNFPTVNAVQAAKGDSERIFYDAFVTKLNPSGSALVYSTYLGGSNTDGGNGIAVDDTGATYVTGYTNSSNFPTVNPFQSVLAGAIGASDAFVTKITDDAPIPTVADLAISLVDSPDSVTAGQNLTYTLTVTNNGPANATGVTVTDALPIGVSFVSVSAGCSGSGTVTCNVGNLASGASMTITLVVQPTVAGGISNFVSVSGSETDSNTANNTAMAVTTINTPPPPPPLRPDLTGSWSILKQTCTGTGVKKKCTLKGTFEARNLGSTSAPTAKLRFYHSQDASFGGGDMVLKEVAIGPLTTGAKKKIALSKALPTGTDASGQFVLAVSDVTNVVTESDETNNTVAFGPLP